MINEDMRLRAELEQVAVPLVDVSAIVQRGRQLRNARRAVAIMGTGAMILIVAIAAATAVSALRDPEPRHFPPVSNGEGDVASHLAAYLHQDATDSQVQEVLDAARSIEGVISVDYVSKTQAFAEFKERYRDEPHLWENLREDALPASLRLTLDDNADPDAIRKELLGHPAVDQVTPGEN